MVLGLGLVACAVVAAVSLRPSAGCDVATTGESADVGSTLGLAERRLAADAKAHAIVEVLNKKPQDVIGSIVKKAMQKAGTDALAKHRKMGDQKSFNQALAETCDQFILQRPEPEIGDGIYLGHDYNSYVYMDKYESGPTQWKLSRAGSSDIYNIEAIVPGKGGSYLAHDGGKIQLGKIIDEVKWRIKPLQGKQYDGQFIVEAVGPPGPGGAYLSRKGPSQVTLAHSVGENEAWTIPCVEGQAAQQSQRKATCAFNIIYSMQYVARASLLIQAAVRTCPNSKGLLTKVCALNSLVVVSSFSNLALAISDAASSCSETTNIRALCAAGVEALIVSLSTVGAGGLVTATACKPGLTVKDLNLPQGATASNLGGPSYLGRRLFLGGGSGNFLGQCVLDFTQVAWSIGSVGIAIAAAARDACPSSVQGMGALVGLSQGACAMDVGAVIYAFGRISMFLALAAIHCTDELNLQALCASGVSALVAAAAALVVTGGDFYVACNQGINEVNSGGTVNPRIGVATESGLVRRLAAQSLAAGAERTDVRKMVQDLGYNISNPLKLPTFDNIDSAMKVLEAYDAQRAEDFGVGEASLRSKFKSVEEMWKSVGVDLSDPNAIPAAPAPRDESERFVKLMEPLLSAEDRERVAEAAGPRFAQKWQWPSSRKCL